MLNNLGDRMKNYYEVRSKTSLIRRMPVIIRLDGKAFHTFTKGYDRPFDKLLMETMQATMKYLCEHVQGCVLGYTQSDEITLVLVDYKELTSDAWFDYEVQKLCSVTASMATVAFNRALLLNVCDHMQSGLGGYNKNYQRSLTSGAMFDARCFNIPKEEVTNCVYWRQLDATRNSIQMVGQTYFSHKELEHKSCSDIQEMLFTQHQINWNDFPTSCKRGSCCIKIVDETYSGWIIDTEIPIFKGEGREYIEQLINYE